MKKTLMSIILTLACIGSGVMFYKINGGDIIIAVIFGFGLLGILLSYLRNN